MKFALFVILAICLASCKKPNVICFCYRAGRDSTWNLGPVGNRSGTAITAECDTVGAKNGLDTCRWSDPKD